MDLPATVGSGMTMNCSVSVVPHLIASPHVELYKPEQLLLASFNTSFSLKLNPVKAWNAGLYVCRGVLEIRSADIYMDFQSIIHLSVQRKLLNCKFVLNLCSQRYLY